MNMALARATVKPDPIRRLLLSPPRARPERNAAQPRAGAARGAGNNFARLAK